MYYHRRLDVDRRDLLLTMLALSVFESKEANALPLGGALSALDKLLKLWSAYKAGEEIYNKVFTDEKKRSLDDDHGKIKRDIPNADSNGSRVIINNNYIINNIYNFSEFDKFDPGTAYDATGGLNLVASFSASGSVTSFASGFLVALGRYLADARIERFDQNAAVAMTRPVGYQIRPTWRQSGTLYFADMRYAAIDGSLSLRWVIDRSNFDKSEYEYRRWK